MKLLFDFLQINIFYIIG